MQVRPLITIVFIVSLISASADIIITGYYDGNFSGDSTSRGMEFYVTSDITIGDYKLQVEANGEQDGVADWTTKVSDWGIDGTITNTDTITAGSFLYLFDSSEAKDIFAAQIGAPANWTTSGGLTGTGDDAFRIIRESDSLVLDQLGDPAELSPWEHEHDYLYRQDATGPNAGTFDVGNWVVSSGDSMSGGDTLLKEFPAGSYSFSSVPEPSTFIMLFLAALCLYRRRAAPRITTR